MFPLFFGGFFVCLPYFSEADKQTGVHLPGTARRWSPSTPASSSSVTASRRSPATRLGAWSQWRRSRSPRSVHSPFHFIHLAVFKHQKTHRRFKKNKPQNHSFSCAWLQQQTAQFHFFYPQFVACVVLWFYSQQCPHGSSPTWAHYRMFTQQETYMMVKQKHVFARFFHASFLHVIQTMTFVYVTM